MEKSNQLGNTRLLLHALKSLRIFKRSADFDLRKSLAQLLILSRINYGNVLLSGAPHYFLKKLQKLQNAAAGFVYGRHTNENDVARLKWLPVLERISLSLVKLAHKSLHDVSWPAYLKLTKVPLRGRNLRSEAENENNVDLSGGFEDSRTLTRKPFTRLGNYPTDNYPIGHLPDQTFTQPDISDFWTFTRLEICPAEQSKNS